MDRNIDNKREEIRQRIWKLLVERKIARPPFPVYGRIPNFAGSEKAARNLIGIEEWKKARTVKINPDSPQRPLRRFALEQGKTLVMPTPRIRRGFLVLDPRSIPRDKYSRASTIRGAFKFGVILGSVDELEKRLPTIDLIVEGSVAIDKECNRLGKGEGYGDLEYAILTLLGKVTENTPIATTISDLQFVERIPAKPHDIPVDIIATPTRLIRCKKRGRPWGLVLESLKPEKIREIPLLRQVLKRYYGGLT